MATYTLASCGQHEEMKKKEGDLLVTYSLRPTVVIETEPNDLNHHSKNPFHKETTFNSKDM